MILLILYNIHYTNLTKNNLFPELPSVSILDARARAERGTHHARSGTQGLPSVADFNAIPVFPSCPFAKWYNQNCYKSRRYRQLTAEIHLYSDVLPELEI